MDEADIDYLTTERYPDAHLRQPEMAELEPSPEQRLIALANSLEMTLVTNRSELERASHRRGILELMRSAGSDFGYAKKLALTATRYLGREAQRFVFGDEEKTPEGPSPVMLLQGFLAPHSHLDDLHQRLNGQSFFSEALRHPSAKTRVIEHSRRLKGEIQAKPFKVRIVADSRGGLVTLCTMRMLEIEGEADRIKEAILISSPVNGINPDIRIIAELARRLGLPAAHDFLDDSESIAFWKALSPESRAKIKVLAAKSGDIFIDPEHAYVEGSPMLLAESSGHQDQVLNSRSPIFRATVELIEHPIVATN